MTAIVLPIYNQERHVRRALDSLLAQTDGAFAALCVDDGSTDGTPGILAEYAAKDERFRVITKPNGGVSSARNAGLDAVRTLDGVDSVCFLDPDDFYHPQCLEVARTLAAARPDAVLEWDFASEDPEAFAARRYEAAALGLQEGVRAPCVWNKIYPPAAVADVRFCEASAIAEDIAFLVEVLHRHRPRHLRIPATLGFYVQNPVSNMHRPLTRQDFVERRAVVERMVGALADAPDERDAFCRDELPGLLKRFCRDLGRVTATDRAAADAEFAGTLAALRRRGLLHPQRGSFKDLKYYLKFLWLSRGGM